MGKEYTFQEVIARIKPGQTYKCTKDIYNVVEISLSEDGCIDILQQCQERCVTISANARYGLVQKPVSFTEAMNSCGMIRFEKWIEYYSPMEAAEHLSDVSFQTVLNFINGKWFIEED